MERDVIVFTDIVARARCAPEATLAELSGPGDVLVLAPHPDDETLAMGGAIAALSASGRKVHVAVVTDGTRSHPNSRSHPAEVLAALRRREVGEAVNILTLGRSTPLWLGYPDMAAPEDEMEFERIATRLAATMTDVRAVWTTWNGDPHPDHQRVWRLGQSLAHRYGVRFFACPVWGRVQLPATDLPSEVLRFPTGRFRGLKARAVAAHASQMTDLIRDDPEGFRMPPDLAAHFIDSDEIFIPS